MGKFCGKCGQQLDKKTGLCIQCDQDKIKHKEKASKKAKNISLFCIIVVLLACIIGGIIYFTQRDDDKINCTEAKTVVSDFLEAYKRKDSFANTYFSGTLSNNEMITYEGYQGYCAERISYKIIDTHKNDSNTVTVTVEIENIDLATVLNNLTKTSFDNDEEIIDYFYSTIKSDDVPTKTYECNIKCKEYPTGMKILLDAELSNALLGGYSAYVAGNNE